MAAKLVLVVDDDPDVCATINFRLSAFGYKMVAAHNSEEACQKVKLLNPELILLDIGLGKENGIEVLKKIKSEAPQIPVIMLTGQEEFQKECLKAGASDYITKPFDLFKLKQTLSKFLTIA